MSGDFTPPAVPARRPFTLAEAAAIAAWRRDHEPTKVVRLKGSSAPPPETVWAIRRKNLGLTKAQVVKAVGVSGSALSRIETGCTGYDAYKEKLDAYLSGLEQAEPAAEQEGAE